jgi:hypothetical protein
MLITSLEGKHDPTNHTSDAFYFLSCDVADLLLIMSECIIVTTFLLQGIPNLAVEV